MQIYKKYTLPMILNASMDNQKLHRLRQRLLSNARGKVLEIGAGSGLNLRHYPADVEQVIGVELSSGSLNMCKKRAKLVDIPVYLVQAEAEALPFPDHAFDTIVTTWTLCSIDDVGRALQEVHRTLKPSGQFLFLEHGRAADERIKGWQDGLTLLTRRLNGGCRINRPIASLIRSAGFEFSELQTKYEGVFKPFVYMYEGVAVPTSAPGVRPAISV